MRKRDKYIGIVGHYGIGENYLDGQTVKTKVITAELEKKYGCDRIEKIDTHGGIKTYLKLSFQLLRLETKCVDIIFLPAIRGVQVIVPLLTALNFLFKRKLHYIVIGGWLPELCKEKKILARQLKRIDCIYVEAKAMKALLDEQGFRNVVLLPNFKCLTVLRESELIPQSEEPHRLCTFSRVMKEKGIEDAVKAVKLLNNRMGRVAYTLNIYGPVDQNQREWFEEQQEDFPDYVTYKGLVPFDESVSVIKNYYVLLFPTYYQGEGFAGTVLDAMSAGVPVVASDWRYNGEIINENNGLIFATHDAEDMADKIQSIHDINQLKKNCLKEAAKYTPDQVLKIVCERLNMEDEL